MTVTGIVFHTFHTLFGNIQLACGGQGPGDKYDIQSFPLDCSSMALLFRKASLGIYICIVKIGMNAIYLTMF